MTTRIWHPEKSVILTEHIGDDCTIHAPVWIGPGVRIGARTKIQAFCFIPEGVTLGEDVFLGPGVIFTNDKYPPSDREHWATTHVHDGAVLGAGVIVCPGVTIGRCAFVGAGAVVTKNVAPGERRLGIPARVA